MRIFISYGHDEHQELAVQFKHDLEARGHHVWFDKEQLKPGVTYERYIEEGLNWCADPAEQGRVILLMTPHSVRRPDGFCLNEIAAATNRRLTIVPVMVVWCEPPLSICRIQWLDMRDCVPVAGHQQRYQLKFQRLLKALEQGELDFEATQTALLGLLSPLDFGTEISRHIPRFVGRSWILGAINLWLNDAAASRVFWISGGPGTGKSAIAAYLCHSRPDAVAYHFCRYGHDDKSDPRRCIMSLAYQLASQFPEYQLRLAAIELRVEITKSAATLFDNLIVQPLAPPFSVPDHPAAIVIDALDEATHSGKNELAEFISREFDTFPPWLRLIITSRPTPEVREPLQGLTPFYINTDSAENLQDISVYVQNSLPSGLDAQQRSQAVQEIVNKSEGVFLYAERVLEEIQHGRLNLNALQAFPQGLGGTYFQFFSRQFPNLQEYENRYRPIIEMIIAARAPLPVKLAQQALQCDEYPLQAVIKSLGSLFPNKADQLSPFHQSIIDWLSDPQCAGSYFVNSASGHQRIIDVCLQESEEEYHCLSSYCVDHLPTHLLELKRWEQLVTVVTSPKTRYVAKWVDNGDDKGLACLIALVSYLEERGDRNVTLAGLASQIGRFYSLRGKYDDARAWLERAVKLSGWWRGRRVCAVALHELGSLYLYQGETRCAMKLYRRALRLCSWGVPAFHDEAAANLVGMATVARAARKYGRTVRLARRAMNESRLVKDLHHEIAAQRLIAAVYTTVGRYPEAEVRLEEAIALCDQSDEHIEKGRLLLVLGSLRYKQATLRDRLAPDAKECFQRASSEAKQTHDLYTLLEAKLGLGLYALAEGATDEAQEWLTQLQRAVPKRQHPELQLGLELGLAGLAHQRGHMDSAAVGYQRIIDHNRDVTNIFSAAWVCRAMVGLGAIKWHLGKKNEAEEIWREAMGMAGMISTANRNIARQSIKICKSDPRLIPR